MTRLSFEFMRISILRGNVNGQELADALFAGWLAIEANASLTIDSAEAWAGILWRIGAEALRLHLLAPMPLTATEAFQWGVADALVPAGADPVEWIAGWKRDRSEIALESAGDLIGRRGGDALERAEFARLFAIGLPQEGLLAFLTRQRPQWSMKHEPKRN